CPDGRAQPWHQPPYPGETVSISPEGCVAIAEACLAAAEALRALLGRRKRTRRGARGPKESEVDLTLDRVAATVCHAGRYFRLLRASLDRLGPSAPMLLDALDAFDLILAHYGWSDDQGGPHSMDNPRAWRASWPLQGPDLPPLRAGLVAALER